MKKTVIFFILLTIVLLISLLWTGCKSKPEVKQTTTTDTTTQTTASTTTTATEKGKLTDQELQDAQALIDRAIKYGAKEYDPDNLNKAIEDLKNANEKNSDDFVKAREYLESSKDSANKAYENSLKGKALAKKDEADKLFAVAESMGADKIYKDEFKKSKDLYSQGDGNMDQKKYEDALNNYSDCKNSLDGLIASTKSLKSQYEDQITRIKKILGEADELGAGQYAKDDFDKANRYLEDGINDYSQLSLDSSKKNLDESEKYGQSALDKTKLAIKEKKRQEAIKAIKEAGKTVENASKKPSIDDKDQKKDTGYKFEFDENDQNLKQSPDDMSNLSYKDVLTKSIEYLEMAKESYRNEDYDQAIKYADMAKKLALAYSGDGIKTTYTVRLIPSRRDCLWRIAEYPSIYNNPFLWPRIWKANKKMILNPDLIFPGQTFVIPEMD
jgi:nucleoid-associated protein YgaU